MNAATAKPTKGYKGMGMEGGVARWYAKNRGTEPQIAAWRRQAEETVADLPLGARVLEVAPGPGYFAIELARTGKVTMTGLDISETFVEIARSNAQRAGVVVDFQQGDASNMPFPDQLFHFVVCQAAFKNFSRPAEAIAEMHRVLRPGGMASIQDLDKRASRADIRKEVAGMKVGQIESFWTRAGLRILRRRAYTREDFERMAKASPFGGCEIRAVPVGFDVRFTRRK
jgi:ubiquinone/menaquinone biosynthesis C-methylase UbiE